MPVITRQDSIKVIANNIHIFIPMPIKISFRKAQLKNFSYKILRYFAIDSGNIPANANVALAYLFLDKII
jgi:hypothetical protein